MLVCPFLLSLQKLAQIANKAGVTGIQVNFDDISSYILVGRYTCSSTCSFNTVTVPSVFVYRSFGHDKSSVPKIDISDRERTAQEMVPGEVENSGKS